MMSKYLGKWLLEAPGTIDITIPLGFRHLILQGMVKSTQTVVSLPNYLGVYLNGDFTNGNYYTHYHRGGTSAHSVVATASPLVGLVTSLATDRATTFSHVFIAFDFYTVPETSGHRNYRVAMARDTSSTPGHFATEHEGVVSWHNNATLQSVHLRTDTHPTHLLETGSFMEMMGVR